MKIIGATRYGLRTVIQVCLNPDEPEWVHVLGKPVLDITGVPVLMDSGEPLLVTSTVVTPGETGEMCHNCRHNWDVKEFIFDGLEYSGKTADELWELVCGRASAGTVLVPIAELLGRSD